MTDISRRSLLAASAGLVTGATLLSAVPAVGIGPIARNGQAKFKLSLAAYSYRDLLTAKKGDAAELTLADFIADCAKFGCDGTELTGYYFPKAITADYLRQIARQCFRLGLDISGTAVGNDFGFPVGEERTKQIASVKQWIDHAAVLGAPVIRIFAGTVRKELPAAQSHSLILSAIEECCEYAGQHGVHLALENHGGPTADVEGLLRFVRDVQSPWFGVNLDIGNFHSDDIYTDLEQVAPFALNVQVKVVVSGPDGKKRPAEFDRVAKLLRDCGYRGYVVLEFEEAGNPREECPKFLDEIRRALA